MTKTSRQKLVVAKKEIRELEVVCEKLSQENAGLRRQNRAWSERFSEARGALKGALMAFDGLRG